MISKQNVEQIAKLSHLAVSETEKDMLTSQLDQIFEYASALNKVNTDGIEPTAHAIPQPTPFREDTVNRFAHRDALLSNAPNRENDFFGVPKM